MGVLLNPNNFAMKQIRRFEATRAREIRKEVPQLIGGGHLDVAWRLLQHAHDLARTAGEESATVWKEVLNLWSRVPLEGKNGAHGDDGDHQP